MHHLRGKQISYEHKLFSFEVYDWIEGVMLILSGDYEGLEGDYENFTRLDFPPKSANVDFEKFSQQ